MAAPFYGTIIIKDASSIRFADSDSSHYVGLKAPATVTSSFTLTLPPDIVTNGFMKSDASGNLTLVVPQSSDISDFTEAAQDAVGGILTDSSSIDFTYNDTANTITAVVLPAGVDHNALSNFVGNEHIDHSAVEIATSSTSGLSGGGNITATRNITVAPHLATAKTTPVVADELLIADTEASNALKKITLQSIVDLAGASSGSYKQDWDTADTATFAITHGLGTRDVMVQVYDRTTYETIYIDSVVRTNVNTVTVTASSAPPAGGWRVLIREV